MILPASYANGFAPRDGSPLYPELWRGCVGAWNPGLGPTGLTLRDWSAFANHATLTNGPTWTPIVGRTAIKLDGTNDYIRLPASASVKGLAAASVSLWYYSTANPLSSSAIFYESTATNGFSRFSIFHQTNGTLLAVFRDSDAGSSFTCTDGGLFSLNTMHHLCLTVNAATDYMALYVGGRVGGTNVTAKGSFTSGASANEIAIGQFTSSPFSSVTGYIDDAALWSRGITASEVNTLAMRRGIMSELAPRRRSRVSVQFNRRRRLLLGASN